MYIHARARARARVCVCVCVCKVSVADLLPEIDTTSIEMNKIKIFYSFSVIVLWCAEPVSTSSSRTFWQSRDFRFHHKSETKCLLLLHVS